jgi:glycosyltransferase involved in cell wall biosynthesis
LNAIVIADPIIEVPPKGYGGTERLVAIMMEELRANGCATTLMAKRGSQDFGGRLICHAKPGPTYWGRAWAKIRFQALSFRAARGAAVVINHGRVDYPHYFYRRGHLPIICWFHNPVEQREIDYVLHCRSRNIWFVGVSRAQLRNLAVGDRCRVIHPCVDTDFMSCGEGPGKGEDYVVYVGRITANKGVHLAIQAAMSAQKKLIIVGKVPQEAGAGAYFETQVRPYLSAACIFLGEVDDAEKRRLLQHATAMLFPIQWNEPFGAVMVESLACGTPVIAWDLAATAEVIIEGQNGFICKTVPEMASAILGARRLSRSFCRADAVARFSRRAFSNRLRNLLEEVLAKPES